MQLQSAFNLSLNILEPLVVNHLLQRYPLLWILNEQAVDNVPAVCGVVLPRFLVKHHVIFTSHADGFLLGVVVKWE